MADSPSKKRRIASQESKHTSTPQRRTILTTPLASPDVSNISETSSRKISESQERSSSLHVELDNLCLDEAELLVDGKLGNITKGGVVWKLFKPLREDSIYYQILHYPHDTENTVHMVQVMFESNPSGAITALIQFCADVSGFQRINVKDIYKFDSENANNDLIKFMENPKSNAEVFETGKYILGMHQTKQTVLMKVSIYSFIKNLILVFDRTQFLYDVSFVKHFLKFITSMGHSTLRPILHTGVVFGAKILSAICVIRSRIVTDVNYLHTTNDRDQLMEKFTVFFYLVFSKTCRQLRDDKCHLIMEDSLKETIIWIQHFPKIFINDLNCVSDILKLLLNSVKTVRMAALNVCKTIVETPSLNQSLQESVVQKMAEIVGGRFIDTEYNISITAVETYSVLVKEFYSCISKNKINEILILIFSKHYPLARAAAKFWVGVFEENVADEEEFLIKLVSVAKTKQNLLPLLVEAFFEECSVMKNWKLLVPTLLKSNISTEDKVVLLKLTKETAKQSFNGESSILRQSSRKETNIDKGEHQKLADNLFPFLKDLLPKFRKEPQILQLLLEIVMLINPKYLNEQTLKYYTNLIAAAAVIFQQHTNNELLDVTCNFLFFLATNQDVPVPKEKWIDDFLDLHIKKCSNLDKDEVSAIALKKLSVVSSKFSLTKQLRWEKFQLDSDILRENQEVIESYIGIGYWHLVWQVKELGKTFSENQLSSAELNDLSKNIQKCRSEFLLNVSNAMDIAQDETVRYKVMDYLCQLHIKLADQVKDLVGNHQAFKDLMPDLELDKKLLNMIIDFLNKCITSTEKLSLNQKRNYVQDIIDLTFLSVLPGGCLSEVFKYYHSHQDAFGEQIERAMTDLSEKSVKHTLPLIVINTIRLLFENSLNKHGKVDVNSADSKEIMQLTRLFVNFKKMNGEGILHFAIIYASQSEEFYPFLYFASRFVKVADEKERKSALSVFKSKFKNQEENPIIRQFLTSLESTPPSKTDKKVQD